MAQLALGTSTAITPILTAVNGHPVAISTDVARHFGKRHDNVVQSIEVLLKQLPEDRLLNFQETVTERQNPAGGAPIQSRAYRLTRFAFTLLAMGFTGKRAMAFKLAYIDAFDRMEAALQDATHHPERINAAYTQAAQVAQVAALAVFKAVMAADDDQWRNARWLFALNPADPTGHTHIQAVPPNAMVTSLEDLPRHISQPGLMSSNEQLAELATACNQQLVRRMNAMAKTAQPAHRAQSALMQ